MGRLGTPSLQAPEVGLSFPTNDSSSTFPFVRRDKWEGVRETDKCVNVHVGATFNWFRMEFRGFSVLLGVLLLIHCSLQQTATRKKPVKKDTLRDSAVVELQKQIEEIVQDLNLLKEKQALQTVCLKGEKIHGKCFLADPLKKRYHTASEDCNSLGGVLATPASSEENHRLRDYIRQSVGPDREVWLGVNDMTTEGQWMDQTGSSITYKNWDTSNFRSPQPDGGKLQNCAAMTLTDGKWRDENCREEKPSVCEFNIV